MLATTKQIAVKTYFKTTTAKTATADHPEGSKREDIGYSIAGLDQADLENVALDSTGATMLATIVNASLIEFSKKLVAENGHNWDYKPTEQDCTIQALYEDIIKPSSKGNRILSKENLAKLAAMYQAFAIKYLAKSEKAALNGAKMISLKLVPLLGNSEALNVFSSNLLDIATKAEQEPELVALEVPFNALLEMISELLSGNVTADDL